MVTEVALTPCSSQAEASGSITKTAVALGQKGADDATDESSDEDAGLPTAGSGEEIGEYGSDPAGEPEWSTAPSANTSARSSIAEDVISRRGSYGRFAQRWFSKSGWALGQKRTMGLSIEQAEGEGGAKTAAKMQLLEEFPDFVSAESLLPRLFAHNPYSLRFQQELLLLVRSRHHAKHAESENTCHRPRTASQSCRSELLLEPTHNPTLHRCWHRLPRTTAHAGLCRAEIFLLWTATRRRSTKSLSESVEMSDFAVASPSKQGSPPPEKATSDMRPSEKKFDITVISRRSVNRAGLRYLRRGIDEDGHVANAVESEQILSPSESTWDPKSKVYSFVQIRGSIPLFFTQTPYSLKPVPMLQHSAEANLSALRKHIGKLQRRYGSLQLVNPLVEKHGTEASVGAQYEKKYPEAQRGGQGCSRRRSLRMVRFPRGLSRHEV